MELESYEKLIDSLTEKLFKDENENVVQVQLDLGCMNSEDTFKINRVSFETSEEENTIVLVIYYNVIHCSRDDLISEIEIDMKNEENNKRTEMIFELLWNYKPCPECLYLIKKEEDVCKTCLFHKIRQQYGIRKGYITEIETCMICQEPVYNTRIHCGHWVHQTCLIKLNPSRWYDESLEIKCPICREELNEEDEDRYFIIQPQDI
jgi:RNA polymerase subunit RPABC4/transcription elongation factor Spt4